MNRVKKKNNSMSLRKSSFKAISIGKVASSCLPTTAWPLLMWGIRKRWHTVRPRFSDDGRKNGKIKQFIFRSNEIVISSQFSSTIYAFLPSTLAGLSPLSQLYSSMLTSFNGSKLETQFVGAKNYDNFFRAKEYEEKLIFLLFFPLGKCSHIQTFVFHFYSEANQNIHPHSIRQITPLYEMR